MLNVTLVPVHSLQQTVPACLITHWGVYTRILKGWGAEAFFYQNFSLWTETTELSLPSRCRSPSQGPTWIWATLHWKGLYSLSHQECYFKLVDPTDTKSIKGLNKQGLERKEQQWPLKGLEREGPGLTLEGLALFFFKLLAEAKSPMTKLWSPSTCIFKVYIYTLI